MTSEEYGQYIDDFELDVDVMPGESLTEYIERRRREFESKADGGSIGIEVLFRDKKADGGRVPMVSGGALKGLMSLFKRGGDDAVDLAKQEEIFRKGPITKEFLETVDSKVINPFVRTRDAKGVGSYGLYDNFDDMPAGLKAAEIIKRFVNRKTGEINYDAAEFFIGRKLKGDETIDELIDIAISKPIGTGKGPFKDFEEYVLNPAKKADGGRVGLFMGGPPLEGQALSIYNSMSAYGFSDAEIADALRARGLYDVAPVETPVINTAPNIINQDRGGDGQNNEPPGFDLGYSSENFGLGPNQDVVDYEAEAAKIGPTFRGQFAKTKLGIQNLMTKMRSLPTPLNIALNLVQGIGGMFSPSNRATREAIAKDIERDKQGEISIVDLRGRAKNADTYSKIGRTRDAPGGGGNTSGPTGEEGYGGFCFDPNTLVQMADGSEKKIKEIQLGDQTKGGEVTGVFQFKASDEIHDYKGVVVAGSHFVKEDGKFIMVQDSPISVKIDKIPVVYSLDTTGRRIFINDIEFADYNGDGVAKNFLTNAGVDLTGFDTEVLRQVEQRLI